jgi:hypothetical protein
MIVCSTAFVGLARFSWAAEMNRFLVSYGGTAFDMNLIDEIEKEGFVQKLCGN